MKTLRNVAVLAGLGSLLMACGGDGTASPDAGDTTLIDADTNSNGNPDAEVPVEFAELELRVSPENPIPEHDFNLYIRAADTEGRLFRDYEGTVSVTSSTGELLGATDAQQLTEGTAFLTLRLDEELEDVTLTVTNDDDSSETYTTEPFDVFFEGEPGEPGDVVINEVNWYGPALNRITGVVDVWIELRNVSDKTLNISQWRFEGAGVEGRDVFVFSKTVLAPDEYLLVGNFDSGSLAGVPNVQAHVRAIPLELPDEGMQLVFKDVEGTVIDSTPEASEGWPAGIGDFDRGYFESMERRDDITGGGYGDGTAAGQWYTWNRGAGVETTNPAFSDLGTPGEDNSDPDAPLALPYETSFELADPRLEILADDETVVLHTPPEGMEALTGSRILTMNSLEENDHSLRSLRTLDCLTLDNGDDLVRVSLSAMESGDSPNDPDANEVLRLRSVIEWYNDSRCQVLNSQNAGGSVTIPKGEYEELILGPERAPPSNATHFKVRIEGNRSAEADDEEQLWVADDLLIEQVPN